LVESSEVVAPKSHGGKRAGAGRKKGTLAKDVESCRISKSNSYRNGWINGLTPEAKAWVGKNWSGGRRATADRATEHALLLASRCPDAETQIVALTWLREQRQVRRRVDLDDLADHLIDIGLIKVSSD